MRPPGRFGLGYHPLRSSSSTLEPALSIKTPRLIRDRCGVYYFRLIVPLTWRQTVKKTEIRRSLRTKDATIARQAALLLSTRIEVFMANSKNIPTGKSLLIPEQEQELLGWMDGSEANKMVVRRYGNGNIVELTPFHGHLIVHQEGVQDAQTAYPQTAVLGAISPANDRTRSGWAKPQ